MKVLILISLIAFFEAVNAQNSTCARYQWGADCLNICGECFVEDPTARICNVDTGKCAKGCLGGYTGELCDQAICKGGCGSGECLAPNFCGNCGDISKISPNCEDIRLRGLLGALGAFVVIGVSITLCGFGSVWYKRRQNTPVAL
uniref:Scavenger receptor class F member 1 n=1 Tax=Phallusia mammillata TaxID=59560 RepID=A0A6F9DSA7_9ASCI|nr:scavenger receptor class F member 1 [Phallusia mammillata]